MAAQRCLNAGTTSYVLFKHLANIVFWFHNCWDTVGDISGRVDTGRTLPNVLLMVVHRLRRWFNIKTTLGQRLVFDEIMNLWLVYNSLGGIMVAPGHVAYCHVVCGARAHVSRVSACASRGLFKVECDLLAAPEHNGGSGVGEGSCLDAGLSRK